MSLQASFYEPANQEFAEKPPGTGAWAKTLSRQCEHENWETTKAV